MKRLIPVLVELLWLGVVWPANAQPTYQPPYVNPKPAISPYINMARGGNAALNYFGLVVPQQQFNNYIEQQQYLQSQGASATGNMTNSTLPITGVSPRFLAYNQYFLTVTPRGRTGGGNTGVGTGAGTPPFGAGLGGGFGVGVIGGGTINTRR